LIEKTKFLYRMFWIWVKTYRHLEYDELRDKVFEAYSLNRFERDCYYFPRVNDDVLEEALSGLKSLDE